MTMDEAIRRIERAPEYTEDEVAEAIHVIAGDEIMAMVYTMSPKERRDLMRVIGGLTKTPEEQP